MTIIKPPPHIVWSPDQVDLCDPFQHRCYLQQVLTHGQAEDIRSLDLVKIERELENLVLPKEIYSFRKRYLQHNHVEG